jgi:hypothetical protein
VRCRIRTSLGLGLLIVLKTLATSYLTSSVPSCLDLYSIAYADNFFLPHGKASDAWASPRHFEQFVVLVDLVSMEVVEDITTLGCSVLVYI